VLLIAASILAARKLSRNDLCPFLRIDDLPDSRTLL
jgi:hypothetical protein